MQDIVMPDVGTENEDDADLAVGVDGGVDGIAVAALVATLRLAAPDAPGFGAMIVRWYDDGDEIEVQIEPLPMGASGGEPGFVVSFLPPRDAAPDTGTTDGVSTIDDPSPDECPRRDCGARAVASNRPARRGRRSLSRSR